MKLFISYSHKDEHLREQLSNHLSPLEHRGMVKKWCDHNILAGKEWETEIDENLNGANIILLLVSIDFIASKWCQLEAKRAMERHEANEAVVVPILLRNCFWELERFAKLNKLPKNGRPLDEWGELRDKAFTEIVKEIYVVVEKDLAKTIIDSPLPADATTEQSEAEPPITEDQPGGITAQVNETVSLAQSVIDSSESDNQDNNDVVESFYNNLQFLSEVKATYFELAVFPADIAIPLVTLQKLWANELSEEATNALCALLQALSLLDFDKAAGFVYMHELIRLQMIKQDSGNKQDYHQPRLPLIHQKLLNSHKPLTEQPEPYKWSDLSDDEPYFWDYLTYHLKEAEQRDDLLATLGDWRYLVKKVRLRGAASIQTDLLRAAEIIDPSDGKLRTIELMFKNYGALFDKWARRTGKASQFAELQSLDGVNSMLQDLAQNSGKKYLTLKLEIPNSLSNVRSCCFSHDGTLIATVSAGREDSLKIWDAQSGKFSYSLGRLEIYDEKLGKNRVEVDGHIKDVKGCNFGPTSNLLVSTSVDRTFGIWDIEKRNVSRKPPWHSNVVNDCCFSPGEELVVSASADKTLGVWEVSGNTSPRCLADHSGSVNKCVFGNDGETLWIISASSDSTLKVWNVETGALLHTLDDHLAPINCCSFSDKSRKIVSASDDCTLRIWDADSLNTPSRKFEGHLAAVNGCCFSTDGKLIVSASSDRTIKVWDVATEKCQATFIADGPMYCCAMHGDMIVAGGARGVYFLKLVS